MTMESCSRRCGLDTIVTFLFRCKTGRDPSQQYSQSMPRPELLYFVTSNEQTMESGRVEVFALIGLAVMAKMFSSKVSKGRSSQSSR